MTSRHPPRWYAIRLLDELKAYEEELRNEMYLDDDDLPCELIVVLRWTSQEEWANTLPGDMVLTRTSVMNFPGGDTEDLVQTLQLAIERIRENNGEETTGSLDDDALGKFSLPPGKKPN